MPIAAIWVRMVLQVMDTERLNVSHFFKYGRHNHIQRGTANVGRCSGASGRN